MNTMSIEKKMSIKKKTSGFITLALLFCSGYAGAAPGDTAFVSLRARVSGDTVLLRWAVSTSAAWKHTNEYGFDLERHTVVRDGEVLSAPETKKLNSVPVTARPLNEWESLAQTDDYAAIVAQALYGEDFVLAAGEETGISKIVAVSRELEQRFSVSLHAADKSFEAALMAGWAWRDDDIRRNERYLYRIVPVALEKAGVTVNPGAAFVAPDERETLPVPDGLTGIFGDKSVMLAWDYASLDDVYNSYFVEKSTDGENYARLDGIPVTNLNGGESNGSRRIYFGDSLSNNVDTHHYRVVGVTAFGETGPPSRSISGKGRNLSPYVPGITVSEINDFGDLELEWEFDERGNALIEGFELKRSENAEDYETFVANIRPEERSLLVAKERLSASNYFAVTAIPREGEPSSSFPVLVQPIDSVPPAVPTGLTGTVDTAGVVTLSWRRNVERDLLGYRIYGSQLKDEEAVPLFDVALRDTVYTDTIDVRNSNGRIYYYVAALDKRYNQSDRSPALELAKPDLLPPSSPVLSNYAIRDEGIEIGWTPSSDTGIIRHRIWRREKNEGYNPPVILASVSDGATTSFIDTSAVAGVRYLYTVTAVKRNLLESPPSNGLTLFTNKSKVKNRTIDRLDAVVDKRNKMLKLVWSDKLTDVLHYEIYKGVNDEGLTLWKITSGDTRETFDENPLVNAAYLYAVRAVLKSGGNTGAKTLNIRF